MLASIIQKVDDYIHTPHVLATPIHPLLLEPPFMQRDLRSQLENSLKQALMAAVRQRAALLAPSDLVQDYYAHVSIASHAVMESVAPAAEQVRCVVCE